MIAIEGSEPLRIFQDANEVLHETVFMVLEAGLTLDLAQVKFVEATDDTDARVEFHFLREVEGHPAIDPQSKRNLPTVAISSSHDARQWRARPVVMPVRYRSDFCRPVSFGPIDTRRGSL